LHRESCRDRPPRRQRVVQLKQLREPIEAQFTALRHFCLDGTDHESREAQAFLIRRYIAWRNRHAQDRVLREVVKRANGCLTRHYY